jgi:hypothetical protein
MTTQSWGEQGFRWFIGVVEDRNDPNQIGRVRVRIYGVHGDTIENPTNHLPWATVVLPATSSSLNFVGNSPTGLQVGSTVFGFFMDGNEGQLPVIFGSLPGVGDPSQLAVGIQSLNKKRVGNEPASPFKALYPFNKVNQTESGHAIEVDDTPGAERLHVFHRSGTYTEVDKKGNRVDKIVGDGYEVVVKDKNVYVQGNVNVTVKGNVNIVVEGTYNVESKGNMTFKAPRIDLNP